MIQAAGQALPLYAMSCFKLPKGFLHELNMLLAGFWWGDVGTKRKIHWKNWEFLCQSELDGGLGFKDMECFNMALLAKQWWRLVHNENSLCYKVLKEKYFPHSSINQAKGGGNDSYLWGSLFEGKKVLTRVQFG